MTVAMVTQNGELHGLINTIGNSVAFDDFKHMDAKTKAACEKKKKEESKMVKARYLHKKGRGEKLEKPYCHWSGEPIRMYRLLHGYTYELPKGFVDEINGYKPVERSGLLSVDGEHINKNESPLEKDRYADQEHMLVPVDF